MTWFPSLARSTGALLLLATPAAAQRPVADLVLHGATVVDGTGAPERKADVVIRGDRIVYVGNAAAAGWTARRTIDATGLVAAPGFIDPHTHTAGDLSNAERRTNLPYLMQGVTTVVTNNDGGGSTEVGATLAGWARSGIGTNAALYVGEGSVRGKVMGMSSAAPTAAQRDSMRALVARAMAGGALGLSTGLYYAPGSYASTEEIVDLARVAAQHGGIYDSHMRDEGSYSIGLIGSVNETLRIAREAHIPVHIAHIKALGTDVWGQSDSVIALIRAARAEGLEVTADQYPYLASGTSVGASLLPRWAEAGGRDSLRARVADSAARALLVSEMLANMKRRGGAASLLITGGRDAAIRGLTLAQVAELWQLTPMNAALRIILAGDASVASFNMSDADVEKFMVQPFVMTGSDGSDGHPRKYGTFPRKLRQYVYEKRLLALPQAVHASTQLAARALRIRDRGLLAAGQFADVVLFDPRTIADVATYEQPELLATGMRYVIVNGRLAVDEGKPTGALAGRALRREPARISLRDAAADDTSAAALPTVVVTATRTESPLERSAAAVTRLSADALRRLPVQTVSEALALVPGIVVLQGDGMGDAPRLAVRGFYGGGETEYVTVLLDGVPLTGLASGQVNWDLVPLAALDAVEVVRGGASSLYGDAAVGGVVNLVTRRDQRYAAWRVSAGELGVVRGGGAAGGEVAGHYATAFADVRASEGYRAHERRVSGTLGASVSLVRRGTSELALSLLEHHRRLDDPGPLVDTAVTSGRRAATPFFRFDDSDERLHRATLRGSATFGEGWRATSYLAGELASTGAVHTLPLSVAFADTKQRDTHAARALGSLQVERSGSVAGLSSHLVLGTDLSAGTLESEYRDVVAGPAIAYARAPGVAGPVTTRGRGSRKSAAAFGSWEAAPAEALRVTLGSRVDRIDDRYEPRSPSTGQVMTPSRTAVSPHAGVNLRYRSDARQAGNVYMSAGRSFKAPTMDQLFDQRSTPVPFPPFAITTSSAMLLPQYGTSVEAGAYHRLALLPGRLEARAALSLYQTDMRDELDFDLATFKYVNIGRSRHRGAEAGLDLSTPAGATAFGAYTQQDATSRAGGDNGRYLKAIPRRSLVLGGGWAPSSGPSLTVTSTTVSGVFLDDANAVTLPGHTRIDLRSSCPIGAVRISLSAQNLAGREYSATGFPDPGGGQRLLLYPAAGRVLAMRLESHW